MAGLETYNQGDEKESKNYLTKENVDGDFCNGCQYRFADLEKQEQECRTCLFYLLQED